MHTTRRAGNDPAGRKSVPELDVQGWDRLSVGVSAAVENADILARASRKISWSVPAVWSCDPPGFRGARARADLPEVEQEREVIPYQSIGWTDLSVTNLVTSSSKKECWLTSNSLRDTFAFTSPMAFPFKKSTDLMET